jgi:murein DD-endopeptidase MepM/ murein hydrolase activator NlpD
VRAAAAGRVVAARWDAGGYGNVVVIRHGRTTYTWYAHLSRIAVAQGERVARGARIGAVGASGQATGPHLHFELRIRHACVDPAGAL